MLTAQFWILGVYYLCALLHLQYFLKYTHMHTQSHTQLRESQVVFALLESK